ncbi:MAG: hypothetical protein JW939_04260, partial [Candidatus Thermoplasmatota archaeon]|nr:hypothetical protein [Candidatus Thermoplasmatota archaeon]
MSLILLLLVSSGTLMTSGQEEVPGGGSTTTRNGLDRVFNATEDEPFEAIIEKDIISGENVTFSFVEKPSWLEMDNETMFGTPGNDEVGWTNFTVNITSTTEEFLINISIYVLNSPPTMVEGSISLIAREDRYYESKFEPGEEGEKWEVRMRQSGPWNTTWLELDQDGKVFGAPKNIHVGNWTVNLTLDDMNGGLAFLEWNVTVVNEPPNITVKEYGTIQEWKEKTIDFDCRSEGDGATYYQLIRDDFGGSLDPVTGEFTFLPGLSGMGSGTLIIESVDFFGGSDREYIELMINNTPPELTSELPEVFVAGEEVTIDLESKDEAGYIWYAFAGRSIIFSDAITNNKFHSNGMLRVLPWNMDAGFYSFRIYLRDTFNEVRYYYWNFTVIENSTFKDPQIEMEPLSISKNLVRIGVNINAYGQIFYPNELYNYVNIRHPGSKQDLAYSNFSPFNQTFVEIPISNVTGLVNVSLHLYFENMGGSYRSIIKTIQIEIPTSGQNGAANDRTFPWWPVILPILMLLLVIIGAILLLIEKTS